MRRVGWNSALLRPGARNRNDFVTILIMATESGTPSAKGSTPAIPNLKALQKESLAEILAESPSLLHPPTCTPHGEYRSSSMSPWRGCAQLLWIGAGVEWQPRCPPPPLGPTVPAEKVDLESQDVMCIRRICKS